MCELITRQWLIADQLPLQSNRLGSRVHPASETGRLSHTHRGAVGFNGDDRAL